MSSRFWLDDDAWAVIEPLLPKNRPARGGSTTGA